MEIQFSRYDEIVVSTPLAKNEKGNMEKDENLSLLTFANN